MRSMHATEEERANRYAEDADEMRDDSSSGGHRTRTMVLLGIVGLVVVALVLLWILGVR